MCQCCALQLVNMKDHILNMLMNDTSGGRASQLALLMRDGIGIASRGTRQVRCILWM